MWNVLADMSEFKYACPVCAQHIKCDSSQAGSRMTCPTCFQEIIVPQAPASEHQTLIISGIKAGDRPPTKNPELNPYAAPAEKRISGVVVVLLIFLFIGLAVGFVYRTTIIEPLLEGKTHGGANAPANPTLAASNAPSPSAMTNSLVPPMADDTNWLMDLAGVSIPDTQAAGRIHGQDFLVERAVFSHGSLILRAGQKGPVKFGVTINFNGAQAEALAGKNLNILADTNKSARVTLHWEEDNQTNQDAYEINYALRLEFGPFANHRLPGRIYLCTPDPQKSYVLGTFNAEVRPPKNQPQ